MNVVIVLLINSINIPKERVSYSWIYFNSIMLVDYNVHEMATMDSGNLEHVRASFKTTLLHCSETETPVTTCLERATATKSSYKYSN